jgi:phosphotransferase system IIB component
MKFNTAYNPSLVEPRRPISTVNDEPTMTKQALADNANINKLIKKHGITHVVQNMSNLEVLYGEITSYDLQEAMQMNIDAQEAFMEVPSEVRKKFGNDAGAFIDFATNPENISQMREWGMAPPPPPDRDWETIFICMAS